MTPHSNGGRAALPARGSTIAKHTGMRTNGWEHATSTAGRIHHKKKLPPLTFCLVVFFVLRKKMCQGKPHIQELQQYLGGIWRYKYFSCLLMDFRLHPWRGLWVLKCCSYCRKPQPGSQHMGLVKDQVTKAMRRAHRNCCTFFTTTVSYRARNASPTMWAEQASSHLSLNKHSAHIAVWSKHLRLPLLSDNREVFWWSFHHENDYGAVILVRTSEVRTSRLLFWGKEYPLFRLFARTDLGKCLRLLCIDSNLPFLPSPCAPSASQWKRKCVFLNPATHET